MRTTFTKAVVVLAGLAACSGAAVGTAHAQAPAQTRAAAHRPVRVADMDQCLARGSALQDQGLIKGFRCQESDNQTVFQQTA